MSLNSQGGSHSGGQPRNSNIFMPKPKAPSSSSRLPLPHTNNANTPRDANGSAPASASRLPPRAAPLATSIPPSQSPTHITASQSPSAASPNSRLPPPPVPPPNVDTTGALKKIANDLINVVAEVQSLPEPPPAIENITPDEQRRLDHYLKQLDQELKTRRSKIDQMAGAIGNQLQSYIATNVSAAHGISRLEQALAARDARIDALTKALERQDEAVRKALDRQEMEFIAQQRKLDDHIDLYKRSTAQCGSGIVNGMDHGLVIKSASDKTVEPIESRVSRLESKEKILVSHLGIDLDASDTILGKRKAGSDDEVLGDGPPRKRTVVDRLAQVESKLEDTAVGRTTTASDSDLERQRAVAGLATAVLVHRQTLEQQKAELDLHAQTLNTLQERTSDLPTEIQKRLDSEKVTLALSEVERMKSRLAQITGAATPAGSPSPSNGNAILLDQVPEGAVKQALSQQAATIRRISRELATKADALEAQIKAVQGDTQCSMEKMRATLTEKVLSMATVSDYLQQVLPTIDALTQSAKNGATSAPPPATRQKPPPPPPKEAT